MVSSHAPGFRCSTTGQLLSCPWKLADAPKRKVTQQLKNEAVGVRVGGVERAEVTNRTSRQPLGRGSPDAAGRLRLCTQAGDAIVVAFAQRQQVFPQTRPVWSMGAGDRQKEDSSSSVAPGSGHQKASLRCRSQGQSTMRSSA